MEEVGKGSGFRNHCCLMGEVVVVVVVVAVFDLVVGAVEVGSS